MKYTLLLLTLCTFFSCSKKGDASGGDHYPGDLAGTIYYEWATEGVLKVDFPAGAAGVFIEDDTKLNSFDVSRDGKLRLTAVNTSTVGNDNVRFTLSNQADATIAEEFIYQSRARNRFVRGLLSPDNSLIMVESNDVKDGIAILNTNGEIVFIIDDVASVPFELSDVTMWLPGNEILLTHGKNILRIAAPYTSGKLVKAMNVDDWGDLTVNHQGTKMALRIGNHVHTMDMDGNNLTQVTTSNFKESKPVFSPDGKYLMIGSNYRQSSIMGYSWDMKIIPNDGKLYNVDPFEANSAGVVPVMWNGGDKVTPGSGRAIWK